MSTAEDLLTEQPGTVPSGSTLVDGEWVVATEGDTIPVIDPGTGEVVEEVARGGSEDVERAVGSAAEAFVSWSATSPTERGRILRRWADLLMERVDDLARVEARDVGKPLKDAWWNIKAAAEIIEYFGGAADKLLGATLPVKSPDHFGFTLREPYGVSGVIIPWNVPAILMAANVGPALAAGNTVVLKPSELAPLSPMHIAQAGVEAGLPPGVLNVVPGYGEEAGGALTAHPRVGHISFTGSPETGALVMQAASRHLVPVKLELGGKSPNVVLEDADLEKALPAIVTSIVQNTGQNCYAGSRLLVHASRKEEVVDAVTGAMREVSTGLWHENPDMGPLISDVQLERVLSYIEVGREEGARLVTGGGRPDDERLSGGYFVEPTLFDDVEPGMRIATEEIFGPVLSVLTFESDEEAIELANDNPYGLLAAIWTESLSSAHRLVQGIQAGQVTVNEFANWAVVGFPFAARKRSGFQGPNGYASLLEFTQEKGVSINLG